MPISYEKEMERLRICPAEVETDEDLDFDSEDKGPEDILEEIFSNHGSFSEHDTESEEDRDSEKEKVNSSEWMASNGIKRWRIVEEKKI
ncbi:hypothetical protein AVEN_216362-1 [Araneus ventricosus]|uniref:Uncharacterized protein n=1 Tax=Araneus ventricosus TaxID=182803 RepID=A0A4Y2GWW3_ARAVE|nr:hypothetical protein AVEN_216362-1 [Araneus ventricosus]